MELATWAIPTFQSIEAVEQINRVYCCALSATSVVVVVLRYFGERWNPFHFVTVAVRDLISVVQYPDAGVWMFSAEYIFLVELEE
jgi:hypothetical protein